MCRRISSAFSNEARECKAGSHPLPSPPFLQGQKGEGRGKTIHIKAKYYKRKKTDDVIKETGVSGYTSLKTCSYKISYIQNGFIYNKKGIMPLLIHHILLDFIMEGGVDAPSTSFQW